MSGLLLPLAVLAGAVGLLLFLQTGMWDPPDHGAAGETREPLPEKAGNGHVAKVADAPSPIATEAGFSAPTQYIGDSVLSVASTGTGRISVKSVTTEVSRLLHAIPLPEPQRAKWLAVVDDASPLGRKDRLSFVDGRVIINTEPTKISFVSNSIILVTAPLEISSSANNIIIGGADVKISHEGGKGSSLVISKGKTTISFAYGTVIYALGGIKISFPEDVSTFNTPPPEWKRTGMEFMTMEPLFAQEQGLR